MSKPIKCTTQRGTPNIDYRLKLIIILYQYWLNDSNNCTTLKQDINDRETGGWELLKDYMGTLLSVQFSCKPKTDKNVLLI